MQRVLPDELTSPQLASLAQTFSMADSYDVALMVVGAIGGIGSGVLLPLSNVLFGRIMDQLNEDDSGDSFQRAINELCIAFVVLGVITIISGYVQVVYWTTAGERQAQRFREKYVRAILSQEVGWFDVHGASAMATKVADLVGKIQDGMGRKFGDVIFNGVQFFASIAVSFYLSWRLSLVLLCSIPAMIFTGHYLVVTVTAAQQQALDQYASAGGLATQTLSAIRTVNALNVQPSIISQYRRYLYDAMLVGIRKGMNVGVGNGAMYGAMFLTNALCYWYGGELVADALERGCDSQRCITGGDVLAIFFSLLMGSLALGQAVSPLSAFSTARMAIGNIIEVLEREPLIDSMSTEGLRPDKKCRGDISIRDLEFAYPTRPNLMVCNNYSLDIKAGEIVALVGPSGCGKSTVISLLLRFYDPLRGSISLDGYDVKELNIRWLRSQLGYVGQEPVLFAGSVAANIAYGLTDGEEPSKLSKEELRARIIEAAQMANAHSFIMSLPQQYDTDVGSNGMLLSGGQKQRIAIARALIKRPAVLLLDEATSALDATSERVVQESIDSLAQSKSQTIIVIAHRLSTIRHADKICVFSEGKIAEMGRHEELLAKEGLYADLVRMQLGGEQHKQDEAAEVVEYLEESKAGAVETVVISEPESQVPTSSRSLTAEANKTQEPGLAGEEIDKQRSNDLTSRIWQLVFRYPEWFIIGFIAALISGAIFPMWGYLLSVTQENFYSENPNVVRREARFYGVIYLIFGVGALLSSIFEYAGLMGVGERISMYLRSEMFEALLRREIAFFDQETNGVGALTTALADDCRLLNKAFSESFARQMQAIGTLFLSLGLALAASWKITLIILATFPLVVATSAVQMQAVTASQYDDVTEASQEKTLDQGKAKADSKATKETAPPTSDAVAATGAVGNAGAILSTACTHIRTVSAFSMHFSLAEEYARLTRERAAHRIQRSVYAGLGFGGSNGIQFFIYALLFWYGAILMRTEGLSFENLMIAIFSLMLGALGLGQALSDLGDQKAAVLAADRIFKCIDEGRSSAIDGLSTKGITPSTSTGRIELRNVSFRYPTRPTVAVCNAYNLVIEPGETVALVGPSGSGKSTIINLLLRFYDPLEGEILFDGHNIRDLNIRWLRGQIGYVGQEPVLFPGSVASNIARGRNEHVHQPLLTLEQAVAEVDQAQGSQSGVTTALIPCFSLQHQAQHVQQSDSAEDVEMGAMKGNDVDADVLHASQAAHAHEFIETFPRGYATDVGEGSIMVSGGQKQRIAIARALVKQPSVLLLDEATSALDANSERLVQQSIDALSRKHDGGTGHDAGKPTMIIIAHRLSTIKNADKICVVDRGRIVEVGRHDDLLHQPNGLYKQLWEKQQGSAPPSSPRGA